MADVQALCVTHPGSPRWGILRDVTRLTGGRRCADLASGRATCVEGHGGHAGAVILNAGGKSNASIAIILLL